MKKHTVVNYATYTALLVIATIVGIFIYWTFTGRDALVFYRLPLPTEPKSVKSGEFITLEADFCKVTNATGRTVQRLVSDKTEVLAPTVPEALQKGCYNFPVKVPVPPQTPPGKYHINFRTTYKTNPLHTNLIEEINSEEFMVVE